MTAVGAAHVLDPLLLPLWGSRLIEASAGTGKTWTIAALYLRLVLGEEGESDEADPGDGHGRDDDGPHRAAPLAPAQILLMTFTRAATRELAERIRDRLVRAARRFRDPGRSDGSDPFIDALIARHEDPGAREIAAHRLSAAAEAMDDAAVFTIDAWVARMLREHAFDSGSLFDEEMQVDDSAMLADAACDYWRQGVYPLSGAALDDALRAWPTVERLTADVRRIVAHVQLDDAGLSLAAVRETVAVPRDALLASIKDGWPERIVAMREWLTSQLSSEPCPFNRGKLQPKTVAGCFDALASWAATTGAIEPRRREKEKDEDKVWARLSPDRLRQALKKDVVLAIPDVFDALVGLPAALARLEDPTRVMRLHAAARIATRLRTLKERAGVHGFQDLLERLDRALHGPGGERLRARIVEQYPVAMVDEFQDTSSLQYRVFDQLYRTEANARGTALLLIGDPKQSIYGFRGADIQSYLRARRATGDRHYLLTTNYRSQPELTGAVNRLFGGAEARGEGAFRFGATDAPEPSPLPFVPVTAPGHGERLCDARGPLPAFVVCHGAELAPREDAVRRFAERAAEHIATSLGDAQVGFRDAATHFRRLAPADIAVLVRDRHEAGAIRRALQRRGIASAYLSDQESVFDSREAADLLHWLRAVAAPLDGRRARLAFATGLVGLSLADLAAMRDDDRVFESRIDQLRLLHREWTQQGVLPMIRRTLHLLDLPARWLRMPDGERRLTNVLHLAELLQRASTVLEGHGDGSESLIRWFEDHLVAHARNDEQQVVRLESDADLVRVVTIHMAKGLEYPVVYLPFVCGVRERRWQDGELAFPADEDGVRHVDFDVSEETRRRIDLEDRQEDLRLLYVALTRARHAMWVGVAPIRVGKDPACVFSRSAFGYLLTGGHAVDEHAIAGLLEAAFADLPSVALERLDDETPCTFLERNEPAAPLPPAPGYAAVFERDWSIASFSSLVRDLARLPARAVTMIDPAVREEVLSGPVDEEPDLGVAASAARHRAPRGALVGNFLHDQLEWLATQDFALDGDAQLEQELLRRCERQGWRRDDQRAADVVTWMREIVTTVLPPLGTSLARLPRILPEMEFWFPGTRLDAAAVDASCRQAWLSGRERAPLPERALHGMLMGFVDLVCEVDGRYWLIDYKSNALGSGDADYDAEAIARSMADHRYDVQGSIYLLALHRLLGRRLGDRYDPATQLGGALYLYLRGIAGPVAGCHVMTPDVAWLTAFDALFAGVDIAGIDVAGVDVVGP